jgi:hypothetical protein
LWARNGEAVRQAIELGEIAHIETASEELNAWCELTTDGYTEGASGR